VCGLRPLINEKRIKRKRYLVERELNMHIFLLIGKLFFFWAFSSMSYDNVQIFVAVWHLVVNDRIPRHQRHPYC